MTGNYEEKLSQELSASIYLHAKNVRINISIHINFYQNRFINECVRRIFLNFRKDKWPFVTFNDLWGHTYLNEIFAY